MKTRHLVAFAAFCFFCLFWFGIAGPACVSSDSTELVLAWPVATVAGIIAAMHFALRATTKKKETT